MFSCKFFEIELIICIKMDLALNSLQRLICHTNQPTYLSIYLCVLLSTWISLSIYLYVSWGSHTSIYLWICLLIYLCSSIYLTVSLSSDLSIYLSIYLIVFCLSVFIYLCVCVCVCVCVSLRMCNYLFIQAHIYAHTCGNFCKYLKYKYWSEVCKKMISWNLYIF